jgi:hypothetical protein
MGFLFENDFFTCVHYALLRGIRPEPALGGIGFDARRSARVNLAARALPRMRHEHIECEERHDRFGCCPMPAVPGKKFGYVMSSRACETLTRAACARLARVCIRPRKSVCECACVCYVPAAVKTCV